MRTLTTCLLFIVLMITVSFAASVPLSWTASPSTGVTGYNIYRASCLGSVDPATHVCSSEGTFSKIAHTSSTSYLDSIDLSTARVYYVTATCDSCSPSESLPSNHYAVAAVLPQPDPPSNLTAN